MIKYVSIGFIAAVTLIVFGNWLDGDLVHQVQAGEVVLKCDTGEGMQVIDPKKVTGLRDGYWQFVNGYASACEVIR